MVPSIPDVVISLFLIFVVAYFAFWFIKKILGVGMTVVTVVIIAIMVALALHIITLGTLSKTVLQLLLFGK